jgi:hypothetical protein
MYAVTLNELKAVLKVRAQAEQSDAVNKTSVESTAQYGNFQEVKRRKRHISNKTSQTAERSSKPVPTSADVQLPPKAVLTRNFFAPLRTTDMDTETNEAENTLSEEEASGKPGRSPPKVMTYHKPNSTPKRLKRPRYTRIVAIEMSDYSAMKSYFEKNYLYQLTSSPISRKPIKTVIRHLPLVMPVQDISNSLEDLGCNDTSVRQMMATRAARNGQTHVEPLPLFLVT